MAISAQTKNLSECLLFMQFVLSHDVQTVSYYQNGGQPAHLDAWRDKDINEDCLGFFENTLFTMEGAYVRPRIKGFNRFQEIAADFIHSAIQEDKSAFAILRKLNYLFKSYCA